MLKRGADGCKKSDGGAKRQQLQMKQECIICRDDKDASQFVKKVTARCAHTNKACSDCLMQHVEAEINGKGTLTLFRIVSCTSYVMSCTYLEHAATR